MFNDYLILGGAGLVGLQVCRRIARQMKPRIIVVASLFEREARGAVASLKREFGDSKIHFVPSWGNLFVPGDIAAQTPADVEEAATEHSRGPRWVVALFILGPLLALLVGLPIALSGWISWLDVGLAAFFYVLTAGGITIGFHRYFTHGSFRANKPARFGLAIAGSLAVQGSVADWVADHRKHHSNSDQEGDPHSPWRYGTSTRDVARGFWHSHMGWLLADDLTDVQKYAPDLLKDPMIHRISRLFPLLVAATLLLPAIMGGLITMSWAGAFQALFWAGVVRLALVHQITWSINSICHITGKRPFKTRDHAGNVAWLAIPALGESWHNYHHADPTSARHGVLWSQIDPSAAAIRFMERRGWVSRVRWPSEDRVRSKLVDPDQPVRISGALLAADADDAKESRNATEPKQSQESSQPQ